MGVVQQELVELEPADVAALLRDDAAVLIDVREPEEFAEERIAGAVPLPLSEFDAEALPEAPGKKTILMCLGGVRSTAAAQTLLQGGRTRVIHLKGGLNAWKEAGLPTLSE